MDKNDIKNLLKTRLDDYIKLYDNYNLKNSGGIYVHDKVMKSVEFRGAMNELMHILEIIEKE